MSELHTVDLYTVNLLKKECEKLRMELRQKDEQVRRLISEITAYKVANTNLANSYNELIKKK